MSRNVFIGFSLVLSIFMTIFIYLDDLDDLDDLDGHMALQEYGGDLVAIYDQIPTISDPRSRIWSRT